jgi:hypothetical protein
MQEQEKVGVQQSLRTNSGRNMQVNRFNQISGVTDVGSQMYHLHSEHFSILFNDSSDSFAIDIAKKPILATRDEAVIDLAGLLGVSTFELCDLNIYISTTKAFDATYSGTNIGLGVCAN